MGDFNTSLPEVEGITGASEYRWESGDALERQVAIFDLMSTFRCHAASTFLTAHLKPRTFCSYSTGCWETLDYILCNRNISAQALLQNAE
eukprot:7365344-Pyramimonas_sp.AAC.1